MFLLGLDVHGILYGLFFQAVDTHIAITQRNISTTNHAYILASYMYICSYISKEIKLTASKQKIIVTQINILRKSMQSFPMLLDEHGKLYSSCK